MDDARAGSGGPLAPTANAKEVIAVDGERQRKRYETLMFATDGNNPPQIRVAARAAALSMLSVPSAPLAADGEAERLVLQQHEDVVSVIAQAYRTPAHNSRLPPPPTEALSTTLADVMTRIPCLSFRDIAKEPWFAVPPVVPAVAAPSRVNPQLSRTGNQSAGGGNFRSGYSHGSAAAPPPSSSHARRGGPGPWQAPADPRPGTAAGRPGSATHDDDEPDPSPFLSARQKWWQDEQTKNGGRGGRGPGGRGGRGGRGGHHRGAGFAGRGSGGGGRGCDDGRTPTYHLGGDPFNGGDNSDGGSGSNRAAPGGSAGEPRRKVLGAKRKFQPPGRLGEGGSNGSSGSAGGGSNKKQQTGDQSGEDVPEQLRGLEEALIERITNEIMDTSGDPITFDDIAGLTHAKQAVTEMVVWPMKRPDLFTGLRALSKGLLLFGPPGTGKTLIGKAIATQCGATFFSISASSLTSKWVGEGEKMVRCLFAVASLKQPAVIFIDEIDSLLQARSESDIESSRRIKTEFLVQLDGAGTKSTDQILVVGATNRPQELDEAARRRFTKRLYIPLPNTDARRHLVKHLLAANRHTCSDADVDSIISKTEGFSGADVASLCKEAAMGPVRHGLCGITDITAVTADSMPPITMRDFNDALRHVRSSVAPKELLAYEEWNRTFGTFPGASDPSGAGEDDAPGSPSA